jgi:hypothetical protein
MPRVYARSTTHTHTHAHAHTHTQVSPKTLSSWFFHYFALVVYTLAHGTLELVLRPAPSSVRDSFAVRRLMEQLRYGAGLDHEG